MENLDGGLSCSSLISPPDEVDDISVFVKQILLRSSTKTSNFSSSSTTSLGPKCNAALEDSQIHVSGSDRMISQLNSSSMAVYCPSIAAYNKSSSSVGTFENDTDEYDGESEDEYVEEAPTKPAPQRSSSKRSRAAEIHNLSEKRRRSRINEKMNALQNLIPNSNKTDKASMLDEAIEYLKQLQLQVQMLTMRNGLSLYPSCLPGVLHQDQFSQMKMGFVEGNDPLNMSTTASLLQSSPNIYATAKGTQVSNCSPFIDLTESSGLVTSYVGSSLLEGIQRQEMCALEPINEFYPTINPIDYSVGRITPPSTNENIAWFLGKRQEEHARLKELEHKATMSPLMESIGIHRSLRIKKECNEL